MTQYIRGGTVGRTGIAAQWGVRDLRRRPQVIESLALWPIKVFRDDVEVATDPPFTYLVPQDLGNHILFRVEAFLPTVGSGVTQVQLVKEPAGVNLLSTLLTIDSGEKNSKDSATTPVIIAANAEVEWGDHLRVEVVSAAAGSMGLGVYCYFLAEPDEVARITGPAGPSAASGITFDNASSGLTADDVQEALDELAAGGGSGGGTDPIADVHGAPATAFDFATSSLTGLTTFNSPDALNANTTGPRMLYMQDNETGENLCGVYATAPSAPFTMISRLAGANVWKDSHAVTAFIAQSTPGQLDLLGLQNAARTIYVTHWNSPTSFSSSVTSYGSGIELPLYLAIRVNTSTNVDFLFSYDGYSWAKLVDSRNPGFTIGSLGLCINANAAGEELAAFWDFMYVYSSALTLPGAAA